MYKIIFKRLIDITLSFFAVIFLSPLFLLTAIIIKSTSKGSVFFKQERVGKNKKPFKMLKFRSMRSDAPKDCPTHLLDNPDMYITKIGRFMRKTSIDELPQIFNILIGQMSIIGPRPALFNQVDLIAERDKYHANDVRPGLTGLAQISGRDELDIPVKASYDGKYVEKMSFKLDCSCFFKTITKVLKGSGVVEGKVSNNPAEKDGDTAEKDDNATGNSNDICEEKSIINEDNTADKNVNFKNNVLAANDVNSENNLLTTNEIDSENIDNQDSNIDNSENIDSQDSNIDNSENKVKSDDDIEK